MCIFILWVDINGRELFGLWNLCLILKGNCQMVDQTLVYYLYFYHSIYESSVYPLWQHLLSCVSDYVFTWKGRDSVFHHLICLSVKLTDDSEHLFLEFIFLCKSCFVKCLQTFCLSFNWVVFFSLLS